MVAVQDRLNMILLTVGRNMNSVFDKVPNGCNRFQTVYYLANRFGHTRFVNYVPSILPILKSYRIYIIWLSWKILINNPADGTVNSVGFF